MAVITYDNDSFENTLLGTEGAIPDGDITDLDTSRGTHVVIGVTPKTIITSERDEAYEYHIHFPELLAGDFTNIEGEKEKPFWEAESPVKLEEIDTVDEKVEELRSSLSEINRNQVYSNYPEATDIAIKNALSSVIILKRNGLNFLKPQRSVDGGIIIEFSTPQNITFIEFENDGEIWIGYVDQDNNQEFLESNLGDLENDIEDLKGEI